MSFIPIATALIGAYSARKSRRQAKQLADRQFEYQQEQDALLEQQKQAYRDVTFRNPYADVQNPFAENVFEDLTVNQQQAQFQAQQGAQQRANILAGLRGAAGASGIAGLAQTLANQGQLQAQQISASIGKQEAANQRLAAQGALQVQKGAYQADMARRGGEAIVQQAEMSRQATLLGMQMGASSGANRAYQQALFGQQQAGVAAGQMNTQALQSLSQVDFSGFGNPTGYSSGGFTKDPGVDSGYYGEGIYETVGDTYPGKNK